MWVHLLYLLEAVSNKKGPDLVAISAADTSAPGGYARPAPRSYAAAATQPVRSPTFARGSATYGHLHAWELPTDGKSEDVRRAPSYSRSYSSSVNTYSHEIPTSGRGWMQYTQPRHELFDDSYLEASFSYHESFSFSFSSPAPTPIPTVQAATPSPTFNVEPLQTDATWIGPVDSDTSIDGTAEGNQPPGWTASGTLAPGVTGMSGFSLSNYPVNITNPVSNPHGEHQLGFPDEGWTDCANQNEVCQCRQGAVRYGHRGVNGVRLNDVWTLPIHLGGDESVQCTIGDLRAVRVRKKNQAGTAGTNSCECMERILKLQLPAHAGVASTYLERGAGLDEEFRAKNTSATPSGPYTKCLVVHDPGGNLGRGEVCQGTQGVTTSSGDVTFGGNEAIHKTSVDMQYQNANECTARVQPCSTATNDEWIYLRSTGHLRHLHTGHCLTAYAPQGTNGIWYPTVRTTYCGQHESQVESQRWVLSSYADHANGLQTEIKLGYGSRGNHPLCLWGVATTGDGVASEGDGYSYRLILQYCNRRVNWGRKMWNMEFAGGTSHTWAWSSVDNSPAGCMRNIEGSNPILEGCRGELRWGERDTPQNFAEPIGIPMREGSASTLRFPRNLTCDVTEFRQYVVDYDPPSSSTEQQLCQCHGAANTPFDQGVDAVFSYVLGNPPRALSDPSLTEHQLADLAQAVGVNLADFPTRSEQVAAIESARAAESQSSSRSLEEDRPDETSQGGSSAVIIIVIVSSVVVVLGGVAFARYKMAGGGGGEEDGEFEEDDGEYEEWEEEEWEEEDY